MPTLDELDALPPGNAAQPQSKGLSLDDLDKMSPGKHGVSLDDIKPPEKGLFDTFLDKASALPGAIAGAAGQAYDYGKKVITHPIDSAKELPERAATFGRGAGDVLLAPGAFLAEKAGLAPAQPKLFSKIIEHTSDNPEDVHSMNAQQDKDYAGARTLGQIAPLVATGGALGVSGLAGTAAEAGLGSAAIQQAETGHVNPTEAAADALLGAAPGAVAKGVKAVGNASYGGMKYAAGAVQEGTAVRGANALAERLDNVAPAQAADMRALTQPEAGPLREQVATGAEGRYNQAVKDTQDSLTKFSDHEKHIKDSLSELKKTQAELDFARDDQTYTELKKNAAEKSNSFRDSVYRLRGKLGQERANTYAELNHPPNQDVIGAVGKTAKSIDAVAEELSPFQPGLAQRIAGLKDMLPDQGQLAKGMLGADDLASDGVVLKQLTQTNSEIGKLAQKAKDPALRRTLKDLNSELNDHIDSAEEAAGKNYDPEIAGRLAATRAKFANTYNVERALDNTTSAKGQKLYKSEKNPAGTLGTGQVASEKTVMRGVQKPGVDAGFEALRNGDELLPGLKQYADELKTLKYTSKPKLANVDDPRILELTRKADPNLVSNADTIEAIRKSDPFMSTPIKSSEVLARGEQIADKEIPLVDKTLGSKITEAQKFQSAKDRLDAIRQARRTLPDSAVLTHTPETHAVQSVLAGTPKGRILSKAKNIIKASDNADPADLLSRQYDGGVKKAGAISDLKTEFPNVTAYGGGAKRILTPGQRVAGVKAIAEQFGKNAGQVMDYVKQNGRLLTKQDVSELASKFSVKDKSVLWSQFVAAGLAAENPEGQ